jgi:translation initiation factor IF-1
MSKEELIELEGNVLEVLPGNMFKVELENGAVITCYTNGRLRQHKIKMILGDRVKLEMSPYDMTKGRITYRL